MVNENRGKFTIISININGIFRRVIELNEMIRRENPDMICIQETHTKEGINPMIRNYTMFSNSWITSSKGTADYINLRWKNNFL